MPLYDRISRGSEGAGVVVGHHTHCAPRLDPLDHLRQAARNARAPGQKCLLDARGWEATSVLLRPLWVLQQKHERAQGGGLDAYPFVALNF